MPRGTDGGRVPRRGGHRGRHPGEVELRPVFMCIFFVFIALLDKIVRETAETTKRNA